MKVTRRTLARILAATAVVPAAAVAPAAVAAQIPSSADSDEDMKAVREQMRNNAQQLAKVALPMATEPAFRFKA